MLTANSAAILTDAFPASQRGMALGINQITALAGQFLGLVAGGLLAAIDWRAVFWVSVPFGIGGTVWSYRSLREVGARHRARIDWVGNVTFIAGTAAILVAITHGIQPYGGHATGWTSPWVLGGMAAGIGLLAAFCVAETSVAEPMVRLDLFRIRAFAAGNLAALLTAIARGGLQFMLIIWLQGIWLPLHGYNFQDTPLWAGIYMLPLTAGFLVAGPVSGYLSDRFGACLRHRRSAAGRRRVHWAAGAAGRLRLHRLRQPVAAQRDRPGDVLGAQHLRDHEQRPTRATGGGLRHALDLPELRDRPVHRRVLLADDRRPGHLAAVDAHRRAARPGRAGRRGGERRAPAAGEHAVRRLPREQPGRSPARADRGAELAASAQRGGADRQAILPRADLRPVPPRPGDRVRRGGLHGRHRRARLPVAWPPLFHDDQASSRQEAPTQVGRVAR